MRQAQTGYVRRSGAGGVYREQLLWADKIVLVYPIWWGRPPAMLMGYIDRMFASGFAYRNKGDLCRRGC